MVSRTLQPWQVWWADFSPQMGHEQAGVRPAIVVGSPLACGLPNGLVIVVPLTTRDRQLPFQPSVQLGPKTGYAMTDQVKSISRQRLLRPHSEILNPTDINQVRIALNRMLAI